MENSMYNSMLDRWYGCFAILHVHEYDDSMFRI